MKELKKLLKKKVIVVHDPRLNMETNNMIKKVFNLFFIPVLNALPIKSRKAIVKTDKDVGEIVKNATNHKALEILYNNGKGSAKTIKSIYKKLAHIVWFNTNNSKAVRNRLKIVKDELEKTFIEKDGQNINFLSIAAGSARAVIEVVTKIQPTSKISFTFLDKNPDATLYSKEMIDANEYMKNNPNFTFNWINDTVNNFLENHYEKFTIIEMVGLMDYFNDEKALNIFKNIFNILDKDGVFLTANINNNSEKKFVTKAIGWPMIYRKAEELAALVHLAGFNHELMDIYYEPHKIHSVVKAKC
jgi:hypothetical protein